MDAELVVLYFDSPEAARRGLGTLRTLEAEGFVRIDECALISRDADGWVTARPADERSPRRRIGFGGVLGLVVGGLVGVPVLGLIAGAGTAASRLRDADRLEELVSSIGRDLPAGGGALALTVDALRDPEVVTDRLQLHRDGLTRVQIPASLREEIERRLGE